MREYRKNDVLERLKAALEAGLYKARLLKKHGLPPDTPARLLEGEWLHPECAGLNAAWKDFWDKRQAFFWTLKQYHAERGREVPELVKVLFDAFVERLSLAFDQEALRAAFQDVLEQVDQAITDDVQMEFNF